MNQDSSSPQTPPPPNAPAPQPSPPLPFPRPNPPSQPGAHSQPGPQPDQPGPQPGLYNAPAPGHSSLSGLPLAKAAALALGQLQFGQDGSTAGQGGMPFSNQNSAFPGLAKANLSQNLDQEALEPSLESLAAKALDHPGAKDYLAFAAGRVLIDSHVMFGMSNDELFNRLDNAKR